MYPSFNNPFQDLTTLIYVLECQNSSDTHCDSSTPHILDTFMLSIIISIFLVLFLFVRIHL